MPQFRFALYTFLRKVRDVQEICADFGDVGFPSLQVVPQEQVEDLRHAHSVLGHDLDQSSGFGVHGGEPHHVRVVLSKPLGA